MSAAYPSRYYSGYVVWNEDYQENNTPRFPGLPVSQQLRTHRAYKPDKLQAQVLPVRGAGFGCAVFRSEVLHNHIFMTRRGTKWFDHQFYKDLGDEWGRLVDWSCDCQHLGPQYRSGVALLEKTSAPATIWQTYGDWAQWSSQNDVDLKRTTDGLQITACDADPQLYVSANLPPGRYRFSIIAKFSGNLQGQLFWTSDRTFTPKAMCRFNAAGEGTHFKRYSIEFESEDVIAAIRWDPHVGTCLLEVAEIALLPI